jgi:hypothetical protein
MGRACPHFARMPALVISRVAIEVTVGRRHGGFLHVLRALRGEQEELGRAVGNQLAHQFQGIGDKGHQAQAAGTQDPQARPLAAVLFTGHGVIRMSGIQEYC